MQTVVSIRREVRDKIECYIWMKRNRKRNKPVWTTMIEYGLARGIRVGNSETVNRGGGPVVWS
jgi:hypothetical protein